MRIIGCCLRCYGQILPDAPDEYFCLQCGQRGRLCLIEIVKKARTMHNGTGRPEYVAPDGYCTARQAAEMLGIGIDAVLGNLRRSHGVLVARKDDDAQTWIIERTSIVKEIERRQAKMERKLYFREVA